MCYGTLLGRGSLDRKIGTWQCRAVAAPIDGNFSQRYLGARFTNQTRFRISMGGPRCAVSRSKLVAPELGRSRRMARCVAEIYSSDQVHRSATLVTHVFVSNLLSALCSLLTFVSLRPPARPSILLASTTTLGRSKAQLHRRHSSDLTPVEAFPTIHLARSKSFSPCLI